MTLTISCCFKLIIGEDIEEVAKSVNLSDELETIEEDVELNQSKVQVELEDSGEEINGPLEASVISLSDSPRNSVITIDDTIIHQKSTGKKKKKKKNNLGTDCKNQSPTSKSTKRKLSFSGKDSIKKKFKNSQQTLSAKKLKKKKQKTENLITDDSVICLEDDSFVVQGNSRQSSTIALSKERCTNGTSKPVFLSLDVTSEKENAGQSILKKGLAASGNQLDDEPKLGKLKKGRYWQSGGQLKLAKAAKTNLKSKKKSLKKKKNKR